MEMSGEYTITAPRQAVWDALNDPEVLKGLGRMVQRLMDEETSSQSQT